MTESPKHAILMGSAAAARVPCAAARHARIERRFMVTGLTASPRLAVRVSRTGLGVSALPRACALGEQVSLALTRVRARLDESKMWTEHC